MRVSSERHSPATVKDQSPRLVCIHILVSLHAVILNDLSRWRPVICQVQQNLGHSAYYCYYYYYYKNIQISVTQLQRCCRDAYTKIT